MKIRMLKTVKSDLPLYYPVPRGTWLLRGEVYEAIANQHGAILGICENGVRMGVKPDEFEFLKQEEKERNDKRRSLRSDQHVV